jgi:HAD superfamily hydrolase (TIGR01509 family)
LAKLTERTAKIETVCVNFALKFELMLETNKTSMCGVLFDLDGVLIDSETLYTEFWSEIDRIYPTGIDNYALVIKGTTLPSILSHYNDEQVRQDILSRIHQFEHEIVYPIYPGVMEFLDALQSYDIPSAIVTSSDAVKMASLRNQHPDFLDRFTAVIDSSMVTKSKPDPQGYLLGAKAINRNPNDCFVFEDSLQGLAAGNAAGATVIGLATTLPNERLQGKACKIIDGFTHFTVDDMLNINKL